jgi:hypothetical protein
LKVTKPTAPRKLTKLVKSDNDDDDEEEKEEEETQEIKEEKTTMKGKRKVAVTKSKAASKQTTKEAKGIFEFESEDDSLDGTTLRQSSKAKKTGNNSKRQRPIRG